MSIPCANLTDVTLADEDTTSILTDNANREIQGNVTMHVAPSSSQFKFGPVMVKFRTDQSCAICN